jgi:class 3 adenylate cyclase
VLERGLDSSVHAMEQRVVAARFGPAEVFLDITGYTKLSKQVEANKLNQLVQTYFSYALEIIRHHHGDISETARDGRSAARERGARRRDRSSARQPRSGSKRSSCWRAPASRSSRTCACRFACTV